MPAVCEEGGEEGLPVARSLADCFQGRHEAPAELRLSDQQEGVGDPLQRSTARDRRLRGRGLKKLPRQTDEQLAVAEMHPGDRQL